MPEVFVSNYMKQQRNFVKYRRQKNLINGEEDGEAKQSLALPKSQHVPVNTLILAARIKQSTSTTPQAQKILNELGLK